MWEILLSEKNFRLALKVMELVEKHGVQGLQPQHETKVVSAQVWRFL